MGEMEREKKKIGVHSLQRLGIEEKVLDTFFLFFWKIRFFQFVTQNLFTATLEVIST